jgi:hypothetical protein
VIGAIGAALCLVAPAAGQPADEVRARAIGTTTLGR